MGEPALDMAGSQGFPNLLSEFVYFRSYSRWSDELKRREFWPETVDRYRNFMIDRVPAGKRPHFSEACDAIQAFEVMPSMRAMWAAGRALERENMAAYNCSYLAIKSPRAFGEILYILLNGTGVGISVERQFVNQLPEVPARLEPVDQEIVVPDSKLGWAEAFYKYVSGLYAGKVFKVNYSKIRPRGARLKTFGGRASGPGPLKQLFEFTVKVFQSARGRKLNSLECHDIACFTANIVVVGGVRRSAMISLSNLSDKRMAGAKYGDFHTLNPQRSLANNSVAYTEKPDCLSFMEEWLTLGRSGTGERGLFNREAAVSWMKYRGRSFLPNHATEVGLNPCGEVYLLSEGLCNLTEAVVRPWDTLDTMRRKVVFATILGAVQTTLTKFNFVGRGWKVNAERDRLLGVSLTGLRDHQVLGRNSRDAARWLRELRETAWDVAREWSGILQINIPAAVTCVKPSGTVSTLVDSSSGIHPRYAPHYIRRVRVSTNDPLAKMLMEQGVPVNPENGQSREDMTTAVFDFPVRAPESSVFRDEVTAIDQLEYALMVKKNWCDHNPSATIYVQDHEWVEVGAWVYRNWDFVSGLTFLPYDGGVYQLPPFEAVSEEEHSTMAEAMPQIDFSRLSAYEEDDNTQGSREFACSGNSCELT